MARGRRVTFYADREDLEELFEDFSLIGEFKYAPSYWIGCDVVEMATLKNLPDLGALRTPSPFICSVSYMVIDSSDQFFPECYTLETGETRCTVDNKTNPSSVRLCLGGDAGDRTLIASQVDTLGVTERAQEMHKSFSKIVRKRGKKIGICYVLPRALSKLGNGWRLTYGKDYAPSQDLKVVQ